MVLRDRLKNEDIKLFILERLQPFLSKLSNIQERKVFGINEFVIDWDKAFDVSKNSAFSSQEFEIHS